jgi:hypothetical protein
MTPHGITGLETIKHDSGYYSERRLFIIIFVKFKYIFSF